MNNQLKKRHTVSVYFCGGAALNIGSSLFPVSDKPSTEEDNGFANLRLTYIDTSKSNLAPHIHDAFYLIEGTDDDPIDGSGKERPLNYKAVVQATPDILHRNKPSGMNIVIHSASGGSGSVIGPVLVSELLSQGKNVVVIMIGSTTCEKEINNTMKTILSYQDITEKRKAPVVAIYLENSKDEPMPKNDSLTRINALLLAAVWSGSNKGLDTQDLNHFLNYDRVTRFGPALTALCINSGGETLDLRKGEAVSSVVTLIREGEDSSPGVLVGYHSFGVMSPAASEAIKVASPIHLNTVQGYFANVMSDLQSKLAEAQEQHRLNPVRALSTSGHSSEADGLIF